jgi:hypothetical protein
MTKPKILQEGASYTFRSYFELPNDTDDLAELVRILVGILE